MCLVLIAWRVHPRYPLIVAANRDEFLARPTQVAHRWPGPSGMIAGKDLEAGGTWMGVDAAGRFAAVTNFRELEKGPADARSRGELVSDYLLGDSSAEAYLSALNERSSAYRGYNLLLCDGRNLYCGSNRGEAMVKLAAGFHGVCNGPLDSDWPKVLRGERLLAQAIGDDSLETERLLAVLRDEQRPPDERLPDTGVGMDWERLLGTIHIDSPDYGTRSNSVLYLDHQQRGRYVERARQSDGSWRRQSFDIGGH